MRLVPQAERRSTLRQLQGAVLQNSVLATDMRLTLLDARQCIIHIEAEPEFNEHGHCVGYTGILQDVTDRRAAEDHIRHLANFDALTGLPNRHHLMWRMERAIEHARRLNHQCALLADRPGPLQDHQRHARPRRRRRAADAGGAAAARLRAPQRPDHGRRARIGGLALAPHARSRGPPGRRRVRRAAARGQRRRRCRARGGAHPRSMRDPIFIGGQECFVTASVGIAIFPRDGNSVADLMRNSDVAMYSVKEQGKNASAIYSPQLAGRGREKLELESALHKAIEREELVLHYQPKIDVRSARMIGAEALMRWQRGGVLVPPGDFIPLAEEIGADRAAVRMGAARGGAPGQDLADEFRLRRFDRGEPAEPAVRALRPGRAHPPVCLHLRHSAPRDPARDHRNRADEGLAERHPGAAPPERDRRGDLHRRLRHRLFVAGVPDDACRSRN